MDLLPHFLDLFHVFVDLLGVFTNDAVLNLKAVEEVLLDDTELELWLGLQDLQYQQRADDFLLLVFVLFLLDNEVKGLLDFSLGLYWFGDVAEVSQCLDPKIASRGGVCIGCILTDLHDHLAIVVLDVVVE